LIIIESKIKLIDENSIRVGVVSKGRGKIEED